MFYWKSHPLAVYRKSVYLCEVCENCLRDGFFYEFGDWKTKIIAGPQDATQTLLAEQLFGGESPLILPRICADLNIAAYCPSPEPIPECRGFDNEVQRRCSDAMTIWDQQLTRTKLVLVSAYRAPLRAVSQFLRDHGDIPVVVVDSVEQGDYKSFHSLGLAFETMKWKEHAFKDRAGNSRSVYITDTKFPAQRLRKRACPDDVKGGCCC